MKKKKLETFEVYTVSMGVKSLLLRTTDKKDAIKRYTSLATAGGCPRIAIDGEQLPIYQAEKKFNQMSLSHAQGRKGLERG